MYTSGGYFLRGNSNLTNGNLTPTIIPVVRPHEGLSIGGEVLGFHDTLVRIALSCDVPRKQRVVKCFFGRYIVSTLFPHPSPQKKDSKELHQPAIAMCSFFSPTKQGKLLPSRKLTYPPKNAILKMIFLFPFGWDMYPSPGG